MRNRSYSTIVCAALLAVGLLALTPAVASAHGALKSSLPKSGDHLAVAPRELRLTFTEAPELALTRLTLVGPDGATITLDDPRTAPDSAQVLVARIAGPLSAGVYTVRWQIAGEDGHPVRGTFSFTIAPGAAGLGAASPPPGEAGAAPTGQTPTEEAPTPVVHDPVAMPTGAGFDAESPLYVAIRWLTFTGILIVLGAVAFPLLVLGFLRRKQNPDSPMLTPAGASAAALGLWAAIGLGVMALLRLYAQSYALHGADQALSGGPIVTLLGQTTWGMGWLLQLAGVLVAAIGFGMARRGSRTGWTLATLGALALAFSPALSGHASSASRLPALAILADGTHIVGAGGWLGSLLVMIAAGIPAALRLAEPERGPAVADLVNAFSPTALVFAGIAATTGVFSAWLHLDAVSALWTTPYGRTLLLKLGILSVVAFTGAYNWFRVKPALGDVVGARRIRRSAGVELAVAVLVLVVTAVLVATPTPMDVSGMAAR